MTTEQAPNYYQEKSYAWSEFMRKTKPKWTEFQKNCSQTATLLVENPKKNIDRCTARFRELIDNYRTDLFADYAHYLKRLCTSYALFALQNEGAAGVTVVEVLKILNAEPPKKKKGEVKGAGKRRGKK